MRTPSAFTRAFSCTLHALCSYSFCIFLSSNFSGLTSSPAPSRENKTPERTVRFDTESSSARERSSSPMVAADSGHRPAQARWPRGSSPVPTRGSSPMPAKGDETSPAASTRAVACTDEGPAPAPGLLTPIGRSAPAKRRGRLNALKPLPPIVDPQDAGAGAVAVHGGSGSVEAGPREVVTGASPPRGTHPGDFNERGFKAVPVSGMSGDKDREREKARSAAH
jgi:hypothetical protein